MWQKLRIEWRELEFTARWIDMKNIIDCDRDPHICSIAWEENLQDIKNSDFILVYGTKDDHLRGTLVEAGMGIALNKRVIAVDQHPDYGTWQYHPAVYKALNLDSAYRMILHISGAS